VASRYRIRDRTQPGIDRVMYAVSFYCRDVYIFSQKVLLLPESSARFICQLNLEELDQPSSISAS
jgi:hypothetical protein